MRILLIHSFYRTSLPSGENDVVRSQANLLAQHGHDVELWGPTSPDESNSFEKLRIGIRVGRGRGQDPREVITRFKPDLVHIHNLFPNISTRWIAYCRTPIVMSIHNYRTVCANGMFMRAGLPCQDCLSTGNRTALSHGCYRDSSFATFPVVGFQNHLKAAIQSSIELVTFPSELTYEILAPRISPRSSLVLPNFVEDIGLAPDDDDRTSASFYLVLGRLSVEKGLKELLAIWPKDKRLVVAGDGPQRMELWQSNRSSLVEFPGYVQGRTRDELLRCAKALILPSIALESDPVVVAQALSAGTPCIVSSHTSSAQLTKLSPAVRSYHDEASLNRALLPFDASVTKSAARELYEHRWSSNAWLQTYDAKVLRTLVGEG